MDLSKQMEIRTVEMHTGGEPLRIVESGYPESQGKTLLDKRRYARLHLDRYRRTLMHEPRGHADMYGAILVTPDHPKADLAVLFIHNEGYSTMCGHAIMALGRYAIDHGLVKPVEPETQVNIQCPCGLVETFVTVKDNKTSGVRFFSVPAFAFATDVGVDVPGHGKVKVDIGYGGAFYAFISASVFGLDVTKSKTRDIVDAATAVSDAVKAQVKLHHPDEPDLAYLYGTILTDGQDQYSDSPTANVCVFADGQVDRAPTGSGVTARIALQYAKKQIVMDQVRTFQSGTTKSTFTGKPVREVSCGKFDSVVVEVTGIAHYTGTSIFTVENDDPLGTGFLLH